MNSSTVNQSTPFDISGLLFTTQILFGHMYFFFPFLINTASAFVLSAFFGLGAVSFNRPCAGIFFFSTLISNFGASGAAGMELCKTELSPISNASLTLRSESSLIRFCLTTGRMISCSAHSFQNPSLLSVLNVSFRYFSMITEAIGPAQVAPKPAFSTITANGYAGIFTRRKA